MKSLTFLLTKMESMTTLGLTYPVLQKAGMDMDSPGAPELPILGKCIEIWVHFLCFKVVT